MKKAFTFLVHMSFPIFLGLVGSGWQERTMLWVGMLTALGLWTYLAFIQKEKKYPPGFSYWSGLSLLYSLWLLFSRDISNSIYYWSMYLIGGMWWWWSYVNQDTVRQQFDRYFHLMVGIIVGLQVLTSWGWWEEGEGILIQSNGLISRHWHVGDLAALALIHLWGKGKLEWHTLIYGSGLLAVLVYAQSRTAVIILALGCLYLLQKKADTFRYKKALISGMAVGLSLLFIWLGSYKPLIGQRDYYFQAITGWLKHPMGVGLGNFQRISFDAENSLRGFAGTSDVVHSIGWEFVTGYGILGWLFVIWFGWILYRQYGLKKNKGLVYRALFLALSFGFLTDTLYFIPTTLWLWFVLLGLSQEKQEGKLPVNSGVRALFVGLPLVGMVLSWW